MELELGTKCQGRQCLTYEDFSGNPRKRVTPSHVTADKRQAHRFRFVLGLKTVNITREGVSVDEETVDTFSVVLKKLD